MKEDIWSIRKMREQQKLSQTRNTYKEISNKEIKRESSEKLSKRPKGNTMTFYQRLQLFLEE
jgi:hypothetical protein